MAILNALSINESMNRWILLKMSEWNEKEIYISWLESVKFVWHMELDSKGISEILFYVIMLKDIILTSCFELKL